MSIAAIISDMDGTLIDTEEASAQAVENVLLRHGLAFSPAEKRAIIGASWEKVWRDLYARADPPTLEKGELCALVLAEKELLLAGNLRVLPGAIAMMKRVSARWPLAIVSGSYTSEIAAMLRETGCEGDVRLFFGADRYTHSKPSPECYLLATQLLNVGPRRCVALEDSEAGVGAAKAAGMFTVAIQAGNTSSQNLSHADLQIASLLDLDDARLDALDRRVDAGPSSVIKTQ